MEALCLTGGSEDQRGEVSGHTAKQGTPANLPIPYPTSGGAWSGWEGAQLP